MALSYYIVSYDVNSPEYGDKCVRISNDLFINKLIEEIKDHKTMNIEAIEWVNETSIVISSSATSNIIQMLESRIKGIKKDDGKNICIDYFIAQLAFVQKTKTLNLRAVLNKEGYEKFQSDKIKNNLNKELTNLEHVNLR